MSLPTLMQQYIHLSRYARFNEVKGRRETWNESVKRYFDYFEDRLKRKNNYAMPTSLRKELEEAVLNLEVMPSMRCLMTAGQALDEHNVAGYNCSYVAVDHMRSFDEIMYILLCGTGVGFSVEDMYTNKLPILPDAFYPTETTIVVADSKLGWAKAYKELVHLLYSGQVPKWDVSKVRPAGAILKTFGGRASGPEPLVDCFEFTIRTIYNAAGRKLTPLECHDIVCKIADVVVVGGVRRSALISLSDLDNITMRDAKSGQWWTIDPQRALANNSYVVEGKTMDMATFMREWQSLYMSKSGERGIFSRYASKQQAAKNGRRDASFDFGTNPCSEIILRNREFCNLTEMVVRADDTPETLKRKAKLATILGTIQATLTDFKYITKKFKENCEEEALLGVSMTGIMDCTYTNGMLLDAKPLQLDSLLDELKAVVIETNKKFAKLFGINQAAATTCVKPSGTVSQLVDSSSGIHARHSEYYIRTVRADKKDPLAKMMVDMGFPVEDDVMKPNQTYVFSFPTKSPDKAILRKDMTAIQQLNHWKRYQDWWCEHKPSVTITVRDNEWMDVGAWVYKNIDRMSGVSFLPYSDHSYKQAPFQECSKEEYEALLAKMPKEVDWSILQKYESSDQTTGSQELACSSGVCEIA